MPNDIRDVLAQFECTITRLYFGNDDLVAEGNVILTIECMKMMMDIAAPCSGSIRYKTFVGAYAHEGELLAVIEN